MYINRNEDRYANFLILFMLFGSWLLIGASLLATLTLSIITGLNGSERASIAFTGAFLLTLRMMFWLVRSIIDKTNHKNDDKKIDLHIEDNQEQKRLTDPPRLLNSPDDSKITRSRVEKRSKTK